MISLRYIQVQVPEQQQILRRVEGTNTWYIKFPEISSVHTNERIVNSRQQAQVLEKILSK